MLFRSCHFKTLLLIVACSDSNLSIAQYGPEQVIATSDFSEVRGSSLVDLDNDGILDAAVWGLSANSGVVWYKGLGNGSFGKANWLHPTAGFLHHLPVDINGDGNVDLWRGSDASGYFTWLENAGTDLWPERLGGAYMPSEPGLIPEAIIPGDVDMDGDPDVLDIWGYHEVGTGENITSVGYYANDGAGGFGERVLIHLLSNPGPMIGEVSCLLVSDLNNDGLNDLVVGSDSLHWFQGLGAGVFGEPQKIELPTFAMTMVSDICVGDLDQDGLQDLVVSRDIFWQDGASIYLLKNDGAGGFSITAEQTLEAPVNEVVLTDMNDDGYKDVLLHFGYADWAWSGPYNSSVWFEVQSQPDPVLIPGYQALSPIPCPGPGISGDIDGDGIHDALHFFGRVVSWFDHTVPEQLMERRINCEIYDGSIALADINGNGFKDLVVGGVLVFKGMGEGQFSNQEWLDTLDSGASFNLENLDNDDDLDMIRMQYSTQGASASVLINDGSGEFLHSSILQTTEYIEPRSWFAMVDIDGDGDRDAVMRQHQGGSWIVFWYENMGLGVFGPQTSIVTLIGSYTSVSNLTLADMDGDGDVDLFCQGMLSTSGPHRILLFRNQGQEVFAGPEILMDIDYQDVFRAGDVDNDNDIDMILWDQSSATMSYSRNDGFGNFVLHQDIPMSTTPNISLSDIDSDGRLEMVLMNDTLGARIYRLDDLGFFTPGPFIIAASASDQVRPYDVDEDGDMDLLMLCIGLDGVHRISWLEHQDCTAFPQAAITWAGGNILQASAGSSYQWLLNGIPMPEAIEQDVSVPVNGSYEVIVTNDFGCTDTSEVFEVVALGFPEYEEPFLRVIPNPASDGIRVFCDQPLTPDMRIEIMDLNGRTVRTLWGSGDQGLFIPRYGLSPGLYGVRILRDLSPVAFVSVVFE